MQFVFMYIFKVTKHTCTPGLWIHRPTTTAAKEPQNISSLYLVDACCQSFSYVAAPSRYRPISSDVAVALPL